MTKQPSSRQERLAKALKANLSRRKKQQQEKGAQGVISAKAGTQKNEASTDGDTSLL